MFDLMLYLVCILCPVFAATDRPRPISIWSGLGFDNELSFESGADMEYDFLQAQQAEESSHSHEQMVMDVSQTVAENSQIAIGEW